MHCEYLRLLGLDKTHIVWRGHGCESPLPRPLHNPSDTHASMTDRDVSTNLH